MKQHNKFGEINKLKEVKLNNNPIKIKFQRNLRFKKRKIRNLNP